MFLSDSSIFTLSVYPCDRSFPINGNRDNKISPQAMTVSKVLVEKERCINFSCRTSGEDHGVIATMLCALCPMLINLCPSVANQGVEVVFAIRNSNFEI